MDSQQVNTVNRFPNVPIYDDDSAKPADRPFLSKEDYALTELLRMLGRDEAAEFARPVRLLGNFKPIAMLAKLKEYAQRGKAALVCVDRENTTTVCIWDSEADASLSRLTNLKLKGGWVLGFLVFPESGTAECYPEESPERELYAMLLGLFARASSLSSQEQAADELFKVTSLDEYSDWQDKYQDALLDPILFPEPNPENGHTSPEVNNARR
jgi:hypothetical protein